MDEHGRYDHTCMMMFAANCSASTDICTVLWYE